MMDQKKFASTFADKYSLKFNKDLFIRDDKDIIVALQNIILSCQRETPDYAILVTGFDVIENYKGVIDRLDEYHNNLYSKRKKSYEDNRYSYIDLKPSALKLLIVHYKIRSKNEEEDLEVIIAIPKVVNKFYFKLDGNYYTSMYQIVDGSTYNNMTSSSDSRDGIVFKTAFHPLRLYKSDTHLIDHTGEDVLCVDYTCFLFNKYSPASLYTFAQYGLYNGLEFFGLEKVINVSDQPSSDTSDYSFQLQTSANQMQSRIFVSVPKEIFDNNRLVQHVVNTLVKCGGSAKKKADVVTVFNRDFWVERLGEFYTTSINTRLAKGEKVLMSLRGIYDITTRESLRLPYENKRDIFRIIQWLICEFSNLKLKDNLNIRSKRLNIGDHIVTSYAAVLSKAINAITEGRVLDLKSIKKRIATKPMLLVDKMLQSNSNIVFRNSVTDLDAIIALKCSYKGDAGIGNSSTKSVPKIYKLFDPSNIGVIDPDASSAGDPGMSGICLVPTLQLDDKGYVDEYDEPLTWASEYEELYNNYKKAKGFVNVAEFNREFCEMSCDEVDVLLAKNGLQSIEQMMQSIPAPTEEEVVNGIPLEESGAIFYESGRQC